MLTDGIIDASAICARLNGGGHRGAAGCNVEELPLEEVTESMDAMASPVSLYEPVYSDGGDPLTVMDQVRDTKNTDEQWIEHIALRQAMEKLADRERRILALRFYDGKTQMEVAQEVGISQAQVSRLEKNALQSIRRAISS